MSSISNRGKPLNITQTLLVVTSAIVAAATGYVELGMNAQHRELSYIEILPADTLAIEPLMNGLFRAAPLAFFSAIVCGTYAVFQESRRQRNRAWWAAVGLLFVGLSEIAVYQALLKRVLIPAIARGQFEQAQLVGTRTALGEEAPNIEVTTTDGNLVRLGDLRGKVVLLSFFALESAPCGLELAALQKIWNEFHDQSSFRMLAIGRGESIESVQALAREHGYRFPMAADADRAAFDRFATEGVPRLYLISRDGAVVFQCQGHHPDQIMAMVAALRAALLPVEVAR